MGRPRGAGSKRARVELTVVGLEEIDPRIAPWELELIERPLRGVLRSIEQAREERDASSYAPA